jgi:hypothetical protein
MMRLPCLLAAALTLTTPLSLGAQTASAPQDKPVIVHLGDGTSQPLRAWNLVYDFIAWKVGTPQMLAQPATRKTAELWAGKKVFPVAGTTLELAYGELSREIEVEGREQRVLIPVAQKLTLSDASGKKTEMKIEAPHRDLLLPGNDKGLHVMARSLDLSGETLTGTKRAFCVLSYTSLVECAGNPSEQVVKLEFQP